jgi:hypothetical protein
MDIAQLMTFATQTILAAGSKPNGIRFRLSLEIDGASKENRVVAARITAGDMVVSPPAGVTDTGPFSIDFTVPIRW